MLVSITSLNLPTYAHLKLTGNLTGSKNEIIVLKHKNQSASNEAHVCHISDGSYGHGIYDMPDFKFIKIENPDNVKILGNAKFTMADVTEDIHGETKGFALACWI